MIPRCYLNLRLPCFSEAEDIETKTSGADERLDTSGAELCCHQHSGVRGLRRDALASIYNHVDARCDSAVSAAYSLAYL